MVAGKDQYILGSAPLKQIKVLINGVGGTAVPGFSSPHLRRDHSDVVAHFCVVNGPAVAQVLLKRVRLILCEHQNSPQSGMKTVAQRKVDNPIAATEWHGRFGPFRRKRMKSSTDSSGKDHADGLILHKAFQRFSPDQILHGSDRCCIPFVILHLKSPKKYAAIPIGAEADCECPALSEVDAEPSTLS